MSRKTLRLRRHRTYKDSHQPEFAFSGFLPRFSPSSKPPAPAASPAKAKGHERLGPGCSNEVRLLTAILHDVRVLVKALVPAAKNT